MPRYLLDTSTISRWHREPDGRILARILRAGVDRVCTSAIVAAELRFGVIRKGSARLIADIDALLASIDIRPFEPPADRQYAELRTDLERKGRLIGANDMLTAAHALALNCVLVTDNRDEFSRVRGLHIESWRS